MNIRRYCPVCWTRVHPTRTRTIAAHRDQAGHICPGTGENYDISLRTCPT